MTKSWFARAAVVAAVLILGWLAGGFVGWQGRSQAAPVVDRPQLAAVVSFIDVAYIFKGHKRFKAAMQVLQTKMQGYQQNMAATEAQVKLLQGRVEQTTDKVEKDKLEEQLAKLTTETQLAAKVAQRDLQEEEARLYYDTYMQMQQVTKRYCQAHGIRAVFRITRDAMSADDRNSVLTGINRAVVYCEDGSDITDDILKAMEPENEAKPAP